jgi:hypothetical protein
LITTTPGTGIGTEKEVETDQILTTRTRRDQIKEGIETRMITNREIMTRKRTTGIGAGIGTIKEVAVRTVVAGIDAAGRMIDAN